MIHPCAPRRCIVASVLGLFLLAVIPASSRSFARYQWPALSKVLEENSVPLPPSDIADPAMTITSFGVINEPSQFVIAFYRDNGNDELKPPLYLLRYDKSAQRWLHQEVAGVQTRFSAALLPDGGVPMDCLGSATIRSIRGFLLVNTHLTPSASCLLILTPELHLTKALSGWNIAMIGSTLVYERSEIHFAPTHPLRITAYDLETGRELDIFPPAQDPLRTDFQRRLSVAADSDWCREHNSHCDPKQMSVNLAGNPATNAKGSALAFAVHFESEGFGPEADADIGAETYYYVFKLAPKLDYRAFDEFDMKPNFGEATPDVLVRPDVLRRLFPANK